ncbi:MAG: hypothetical protein ACWA6X_03760 [Bauldia sp.]
MQKADIIRAIAARLPNLPAEDIEAALDSMLDALGDAMAAADEARKAREEKTPAGKGPFAAAPERSSSGRKGKIAAPRSGFRPGRVPVSHLRRLAGRKTFFTNTLAGLIKELSEAEKKAGPKPAAAVAAATDPALPVLAAPLARLIAASRARTSEDNIARMVDVVLPSVDPAGPVLREIEADNAVARVEFFETVPTLTNAELAAQAGHAARNHSATGARWKAAKKVFSVPFKGMERFPAFQFADGRPRPVIGRVLAALPEKMTPWQVAFWFVASNPWLDGKVPQALLDDEDAVMAAARMEGAPAAG